MLRLSTADSVDRIAAPAAKRTLRLWLIAAAALVLFLSFLGRADIIASHEARVAQTAREMAAAGPPWNAVVQVPRITVVKTPDGARLVAQYDAPPLAVNPWIVPVINGEMRIQKPPLAYWCAAAVSWLFGSTATAARFVPALLGALAAVVMFDFGRALYGRTVGWICMLVFFSSTFVYDEYRKAMADPYLAFFTLTAFWGWTRASLPEARRGWVIVTYVSIALGMLAKGPVILIPVVLGIAAYQFCFRRRFPRGPLAHLMGLILMVALSIAWPIYVVNRVPDAIEVWRFELTRGLTETVDHRRAWWFYLLSLFQLSTPWTLAFLLGLYMLLKRRNLRGLFPVIWLFAVLIAMSFSRQKKIAYLLPILPAILLIASLTLRTIFAFAANRRILGWFGLVHALQTCIVVAFALLATVASLTTRDVSFVAFPIAASALIPAILTVRYLHRPRPWLVAAAATFGLAHLVFFGFVTAAEDNVRSPRRFANAIAPLVSSESANVITSAIPPEAAFYLPLGLRYRPAASEQFLIVDDQADVAELGVGYFNDKVPVGRVLSGKQIRFDELPPSSRRLWKLYRLRMAPAE